MSVLFNSPTGRSVIQQYPNSAISSNSFAFTVALKKVGSYSSEWNNWFTLLNEGSSAVTYFGTKDSDETTPVIGMNFGAVESTFVAEDSEVFTFGSGWFWLGVTGYNDAGTNRLRGYIYNGSKLYVASLVQPAVQVFDTWFVGGDFSHPSVWQINDYKFFNVGKNQAQIQAEFSRQEVMDPASLVCYNDFRKATPADNRISNYPTSGWARTWSLGYEEISINLDDNAPYGSNLNLGPVPGFSTAFEEGAFQGAGAANMPMLELVASLTVPKFVGLNVTLDNFTLESVLTNRINANLITELQPISLTTYLTNTHLVWLNASIGDIELSSQLTTVSGLSLQGEVPLPQLTAFVGSSRVLNLGTSFTFDGGAFDLEAFQGTNEVYNVPMPVLQAKVVSLSNLNLTGSVGVPSLVSTATNPIVATMNTSIGAFSLVTHLGSGTKANLTSSIGEYLFYSLVSIRDTITAPGLVVPLPTLSGSVRSDVQVGLSGSVPVPSLSAQLKNPVVASLGQSIGAIELASTWGVRQNLRLDALLPSIQLESEVEVKHLPRFADFVGSIGSIQLQATSVVRVAANLEVVVPSVIGGGHLRSRVALGVEVSIGAIQGSSNLVTTNRLNLRVEIPAVTLVSQLVPRVGLYYGRILDPITLSAHVGLENILRLEKSIGGFCLTTVDPDRVSGVVYEYPWGFDKKLFLPTGVQVSNTERIILQTRFGIFSVDPDKYVSLGSNRWKKASDLAEGDYVSFERIGNEVPFEALRYYGYEGSLNSRVTEFQALVERVSRSNLILPGLIERDYEGEDGSCLCPVFSNPLEYTSGTLYQSIPEGE